MVWFGSILVTTDPERRMERTCVPMAFAEKAATAGMVLIDDEWAQSTHELFTKWHYGCKFIVWRMFYEEDWNKTPDQDKRDAIQQRQREIEQQLDRERAGPGPAPAQQPSGKSADGAQPQAQPEPRRRIAQ